MKNLIELNTEFWNYIEKNVQSDPTRLLLRDSGKIKDFPLNFAVTQIECRRKTQRKLTTYLKHEKFLFPSVLASEQATHQCVAAYHAGLVGSGKRVLDMTTGLGIDAFSIATAGNTVTAAELDPDRFKVLQHNAALLPDGVALRPIEADSVAWLQSDECPAEGFDVIFVDPARRDSANQRTYFFKDCLPDIVTNFDKIITRTERLIIKASPILDLHQATKEISDIREFHIVCVQGECKEVLIIVDKPAITDDPKIVVVNLKDDSNADIKIISRFEMTFGELSNSSPICEEGSVKAGAYLYDPNAGVHKLNASDKLCNIFKGLSKVSANTDLYISEQLYSDFPGRTFEIDEIIEGKTQKLLKRKPFEVAVRNYPISAEQLRKN